jgi:RNA polymerase sigma factor (sigma-70 family)
MHDTQTNARRWRLADAYRSELIAQAQRRGLTREEAEDVASEAILRAGAKGDLDLDRAENWLRRVTRNLAVDAHRARLTPAAASRLAHAHDPAPLEPQTVVDDQLEACWVASLITRLPARQQLVLHQKAEEHSMQDIATHLGVPYKTVESLASRARTKMREALAGAFGVLALLGGLLRRAPRASTGPIVLVAAGTLALSFPLAPHSVSPDWSTPAPLLFRVVDREPTSAGVSFARPAAAHSTAPKSERSTPAVTELVPAGAVGPVTHTGVKTTRRDADRTLLDSVNDCLAGGVEITDDNIGCAG